MLPPLPYNGFEPLVQRYRNLPGRSRIAPREALFRARSEASAPQHSRPYAYARADDFYDAGTSPDDTGATSWLVAPATTLSDTWDGTGSRGPS